MTGTTRTTAAERRGVPGPPRTSTSTQAEAAAAGVVLRLQREAGNEAVAQLVLTGHGPGPPLFLVARDPTDGGTPAGCPTPAGASGADTTKPYQDLLQPSLDEAQQQTLHQAAGGAGLVDLIGQRDQLRTLLIRASYDAPSGGVPEPSFGTVDGGTGAGSRATENPEQAAADREEERLTAQINAKLAELPRGRRSRPDEQPVPTMFLDEAKTVALGMLDDNQQKVQGELDLIRPGFGRGFSGWCVLRGARPSRRRPRTVVAWCSIEDLGIPSAGTESTTASPKPSPPSPRCNSPVIDDIGLLAISADAAERLYRLVDAADKKRILALSSNLHLPRLRPAHERKTSPRPWSTACSTTPTSWSPTANPYASKTPSPAKEWCP